MDQFQVSYITVENEAVGGGRYRPESAMTVTVKQKTVGGIIATRERRSLVFIAREDQVGLAIAVDVRADDGIHGGDLGHKRKRMKSEMPMAVVLEPAAVHFFAFQHLRACHHIGGKQLVHRCLCIGDRKS